MGSPYPPFFVLLLFTVIVCFYFVSMCLCFVLGMNLGCILAFPWVDLMGSSGGRYLASVPSNLRRPLLFRVHGIVLGCMFPPKGFRGWSILGLLHRQVVSYGCNVYPDRTLEVKMKIRTMLLFIDRNYSEQWKKKKRWFGSTWLALFALSSPRGVIVFLEHAKCTTFPTHGIAPLSASPTTQISINIIIIML